MIRAIFLVAAFCLRNWCFKRLSVLNIGKIVITPPCKTVWTLQNPRIFSRWSNSSYNVLIRRNCRVCLHQNLERKHVWRIFIYSVSWLALGDFLRDGEMITVKPKKNFQEANTTLVFISSRRKEAITWPAHAIMRFTVMSCLYLSCAFPVVFFSVTQWVTLRDCIQLSESTDTYDIVKEGYSLCCYATQKNPFYIV